jgi:hypothetical protein
MEMCAEWEQTSQLEWGKEEWNKTLKGVYFKEGPERNKLKGRGRAEGLNTGRLPTGMEKNLMKVSQLCLRMNTLNFNTYRGFH